MLSISCPNPSHQSLSSDHPTSSNLSNHPSITTSQNQLSTHQFLFHHHFAKSTLDPSILIPSPLPKNIPRPTYSYSILSSLIQLTLHQFPFNHPFLNFSLHQSIPLPSSLSYLSI